MAASGNNNIHVRPTVSVADERVKKMMSRIQQDGYSIAGVQETASLLNLSRSRLCHKFSEELRISPLQYAKRLSLERAKELIETTHRSIKEIALTVGYKSPSRFANDFKKAYGLSPTQWRARCLS